MTITINVPVFPLRKEIAARKRRLGLSLGLRRPRSAPENGGTDLRYTAEGLEFDVTGLGKPRGPKGS